MRIAIFQDTYLPSVNGLVVTTARFIRGMHRRGHETLLVVPRHSKKPPPDEGGAVFLDAIPADWVHPGSSIVKLWKTNLGPALHRFRPELIHSTTEWIVGAWLASQWKRQLHIPRVHTFHTLWSE